MNQAASMAVERFGFLILAGCTITSDDVTKSRVRSSLNATGDSTVVGSILAVFQFDRIIMAVYVKAMNCALNTRRNEILWVCRKFRV